MFSLDELIKKIANDAKMGEDKVRKLVEEKQEELSGLVSAEGAAYIVGRELGVTILVETKRELKIKNIAPGMRSVDVLGKVVRVWEPREFEKDGKKGSVANIVLGDDTGTVRLSLWNDNTKLVTEGKLKEDDVIRVTRAWVKKDYRDEPELRLGRNSKIDKVDEDIEVQMPEPGEKRPTERASIGELKEGDYAEVRSCLVQLFKRNPLYKTCPTCNGRVEEADGKFRCAQHGEVEPQSNLVLSGVIDDGSGNIRAVFFREQAEKLLGRPASELASLGENVLSVYENFGGLGRELIIRGRVRKNDFTDSVEFIANDVADVDVVAESKALLRGLKS